MSDPQSAASAANPQRWWVLFGISLGVLMSALDTSIVHIALPTLVRELHTSFATAQWVVLSYLLVITALLLGVARLSDMLGRKRIYNTGLVLFTLGSVLCGFAPSVGWLIGFRALQGLGAVMVTALGTALVTEVFPASERGRALGIVSSALSVGIALGPSVGGALIGLAGWRAIFLVNLPIGIIATAITARFIPASAPSQPRQRFDLPGALILTGTLACYALGMTMAQTPDLRDGRLLTLLTAAVVGLVVFVTLEARVRQPMIDLRLFRNPMFSLSLLIGLLVFAVVTNNLLLLPFFLERVKGFSIAQTGLLMAVVPVIMAAVAPVSGALSDRFGARAISLLGLALMMAGYLLATTLSADVGVAGFLLRLAPLGIGFGVFHSPNNSAVMGAAPRERLGVSSGLLALSRTLGQTTGVPLMGALFSGQLLAAGASDVNTAAPDAIVAALHATFTTAAWITGATLLVALACFWLERRTARPPRIVAERLAVLE